jgi:hypothetical protein
LYSAAIKTLGKGAAESEQGFRSKMWQNHHHHLIAADAVMMDDINDSL